MIQIDLMNSGDIAFAVAMTDIERWGNTTEDFSRLITIEPKGCLVAREDGREVGMITSTSYGSYGFIGSLIVDDSARGKGVGEQLMIRAIDYLHGKGVECIELDGVFPALSLYHRLGFRDKYLSMRLMRPADADRSSPRVSPARMGLDEIAAFDLAETGLDRSHILCTYTEIFETNLFVSGQDKIYGFALVKPRAGDLMAIGPMVAVSNSVAETLASDIIDSYGDRPLAVGVPALNQAAANIFVRYGFMYTPPSLRMYLGRRIDYEKSLFAIFSAEKG